MPHRVTTTGKPLGGGVFSRGQLYHILRRVVYIGEIAHKDVSYPGTHTPIIDRETFAKVQQMLADNTLGTSKRQSASVSLLAGKLFDAGGEPLLAVHSAKGKVRYRYYVSRALHHKLVDAGMRIPAREIEMLVIGRLAEGFDDPLHLMAIARLDVPADALAQYCRRCEEVGAALRGKDRDLLQRLISRVEIKQDRVDITLAAHELAAALKVTTLPEPTHRLVLEARARLTKSGRAMRLIHGGRDTAREIDRSLVKLLIRA